MPNTLIYGKIIFCEKDSFDTEKMEDKRHEKSWYFYGRRM